MTGEMTHEQAAEEIEAVALGIAPDEVAQGVAAHATRCPECAAELRGFHHVVTSLSALIPERQLNRGHSAGIKSRLFAKATAGQDGAPRKPARTEPVHAPEPRAMVARPVHRDGPDPGEGGGSRLPLWIAGGALVIALMTIGAWLGARGDQGNPAGAAVEEPTDLARIGELERAVAERDTTIASLSGPEVRIIGLFNRDAREPLARMFWDRRGDRWTLFVYSLRQPRAGKTFQVWLGTDRGHVRLGTFDPESNGTGTVTAERAVAIAELNTVLISEEDVGGTAPAPTGPVVLAGALR